MVPFHFQTAIIPGVIAGVITIFTSWLWMAVIFHRFQNRTPETWRRETGLSYAASSALHVLAAIAIAIFFTVLKQHAPALFETGIHCVVAFALAVWAGFALPIILEAAIFIRLHPLVVVGQLLDWLTTSLLATLVTAWWQGSGATSAVSSLF
jgi:hypothetical protein